MANLSTVRVELALDLKQLQGSLTTEALPSAPEGRIYALWVVVNSSAPITTDGKNAVLIHTFATNLEAREQRSFLLPPLFQQMPDAIEAIAITIEDAAAPQAHESAPIFKQSFEWNL